MNAVLLVNRLSKSFGRVSVLDEVSFEINASALTTLTGENGAGKSTLLRCLAGVLTADSGSVTFDGKAVSELPSLGYVGPEVMLYGDLTAEENLLLFAKLCAVADAERQVTLLCERLGVSASLRKRVRVCSQGTLRRLSLARALIASPSLLLLDEVFANVDLQNRERIAEVLRERVSAGACVLLASNDPAIIEQFSEQTLELVGGQIPPAAGADVSRGVG